MQWCLFGNKVSNIHLLHMVKLVFL